MVVGNLSFVCHSGVPQNKMEALRLYQDAAGKGSMDAVQRLKALRQYQPAFKSTSKGMCNSLSSSFLACTTMSVQRHSQPATSRACDSESR